MRGDARIKIFSEAVGAFGPGHVYVLPSALLRSSRCSGKDREPTSLPSPGVPFPRGPGGADATGPREFRATLPGLGARGPPCPDTTSCRARGAVRVGAVRS